MGKEQKITKLGLNLQGGPGIEVPDALVQEATRLYERGQYVDAWQVTQKAGPLKQWKGVAAQVFGSRLANNVGAPRLGALLICRATREAAHVGGTGVHYAYYVETRRGPLAAWLHCLEAEKQTGLEALTLADLKARRASIAAGHRDFETAWKLWDEAVAVHVRSSWLMVERSTIHLAAEERQEALAALDEALVLQPWFRPAVQFRARVLHMLGRAEEAVSFLTEADSHLQSCGVVAQLIGLKRELEDHAGMEALAARFDTLAVLAEEPERHWIAARRMDVHLARGDFARAAEAAETLPGDYASGLAARLRAPGVTHRWKRLPFEFVHQKHNTCAPATLAALAHYWKHPVTMEQIVDDICYDGTRSYGERTWAEANGFAVREFKITLEATRLLIDRGMPFLMNTVEVTSAHAQAVIGYDELRQTLVIQDPSEPHYREVEAETFLAEYKLTGPQGLLMLPQEKAAELAELEPHLPDAALHDIAHRFNKALAHYQLPEARAALQALDEQAPGHPLTLLAHVAQANFDRNEVERLQWVDRLQEMFPADPRVLNWKYVALRSMGHRDERLKLLREALKAESPHPGFLKYLAEELMEDARDWHQARPMTWRAHARMAGDASMVVTLADMLRRTQRVASGEWLTFFRFAAAMASKVEDLAQTWFAFAQTQGRADEALQWLRWRWREFGTKSGAPAITLAQALDALSQPEMLDVLREGLAMKPDDGDLLLHLARVEARVGSPERAMELLEQATPHCPPGAWLRASAALKRLVGDHAGEMATWNDILIKEPLALDAHRAVCMDLAAARGQDAVLLHLETACMRFPSHYGLAQLHVGWLREFDNRKAAAEARRLISLHPADPWALRELALTLGALGTPDKALEPARQAVAIAPDQAASHAILGMALSASGHAAESEKCFRHAITLDVNYASSFEGLLSQKPETAARREALAFIRAEMIRQVLTGSGLHSYRDHAFSVLTPDELLAELREIHSARPDLWEAWSVLIAHLMDCGRRDEAVLLAQEATQKFALVPGAWRDMAEVWRATEKPEAAIQCARHALKLNPDWSDGWCLLAELLQYADQGQEAAATLRRARERLPMDMTVRRMLASLLWRMNAREEAWQIAEQVAQQDPGQTWAWGCLKAWGDILQKQSRVIEVAQQLTRDRPEEARSWLTLAQLLPLERITDLLAALDRAVALNPKLVEAYDLRMEILAQLGRADEAAATLDRVPWSAQDMPHVLDGRRAWLRAVRGNVPEAMRLMRQVLDRHGDYFWGWEMYALWAEQRSELKEWTRAAQEMVRLAPRSAAALCTLADCTLHSGEKELGARYLRQALHLEPGNASVAHRLLSLHWGKRDVAAVRGAADSLPDLGTVGLVRRVYLMLAAAHDNDVDKVRADLGWLAVHPDMMGPLLNEVLSYFQGGKKKFKLMLDEVMESVVLNDTTGPAFAVLWVQREAQSGRWNCWNRLSTWLPRLGQQLDPAIGEYLDLIGQAGAGKPHVASFIQACGPALRQRGEIWGKVGYALTCSSCFQICADWLQPDYLRPDAEGWMLWNLTTSLRHLLKPDEAAQISIHVVESGIRDSTWSMHVAVAALGYAWKGEYETAGRLVNNESAPESTPPEERLLLCIARALCDVMTRSPSDGRFYFKNFLASSKVIIKDGGFTLQARLDYDAAVARMKAHTGAMVLPWEKGAPKEKRRVTSQQGSGFGPIPRGFYFVGIMVALQLLRHCPDSTPSHAPSRTSFDDIRRAAERQAAERQRTEEPQRPPILPSLDPKQLPGLFNNNNQQQQQPNQFYFR